MVFLGFRRKRSDQRPQLASFALFVVWCHSLAFEKISREFFFKKRHPEMLADSGRHSARKTSFSRMSRRVALPEPTSFDFSGRSNRHSSLLGKSVFADEILGCCSCLPIERPRGQPAGWAKQQTTESTAAHLYRAAFLL